MAPHAQHTQRLGIVVRLVGHALGRRAGERLLSRLGMAMDADTIVRVVKRSVPPPEVDATLRVVGIDELGLAERPTAFRHHLGGFEATPRGRCPRRVHRRCRGTWLAAHPGIRIISRDRHGPYADGVRRGAPQAREVADRFIS